MIDHRQTIIATYGPARVVGADSAYFVDDSNRDRDVVVNASYCGLLPARFMAEHRPRATVGLDCGVGKDGAAIAGLWFFEGLGIPAAAAGVARIEADTARAVYSSGMVTFANGPALDCGVEVGDWVSIAAEKLATYTPLPPRAADRIARQEVARNEQLQRAIVCLDSMAFGLPEDRDTNVLCCGGHAGSSAVANILRVRPWAFICSDGGGGPRSAMTSALRAVEGDGLAGATVDVQTARMGDGQSTYFDGLINDCNVIARERGVHVGQPATQAAAVLLDPRRSK